MGTNSTVDSMKQEPDRNRERLPVAAATTAETSWGQHCGTCVGRIAAIAAGRNPVAFRHRRFESCPAHAWRSQPMAGDGSRLENGRPHGACEFDPRLLRRWKVTRATCC